MKSLGTKTLETERLILRKFEISDIEKLYEDSYMIDEKTCENLSWNAYKDKEKLSHQVLTWIDNYKNLDFYKWLIVNKDNNDYIGSIDIVNLYKNKNYGEVGYAISSSYWNKGYATESLRRVIEYLLLECEFHLVEAHHAGYNPASGRVMEKAGMKKDAELRERRLDKNTGKYTTQVYYSILKEEL